MRIAPVAVVLTLLISATVSYGVPKTVEVTGFAECTDCQQNNIQHSHALKGLKVTIDCKLANGKVKTRGTGELDEQGKFRVSFPKHLVKDGKLKEECYAQLHGASNTPCPTHNNGIESTKLASLSETSDGKHTFSPAGKLKFSSATCTSAFLWPHFKLPFSHFKKPYTFPPIWKKPFPSIPKINKPCPPIVPIYKKPLPPPVPVYHKPLPPPVPLYHKPVLPPVPVYYKSPKMKKPCPPIFKKKPITLPPLPELPPFPKKKPCPPLPQLPFPKFPAHPKYKMPSWPKYPPHQ
ncbi:proline-rich protein 4-like [Silene latifolia]|uniref:proline-rich protein 4-like n=1 Tax=Silene latifolia TaxID=37657 RepID=UPI003D78A719